jgi:FAD/FMN-containing dehydrogenase
LRRGGSIRCSSSTRRRYAQAGLTELDLERVLGPRNRWIGDYPPVVLTSSLGGILAVRTPGKSRARDGFWRERGGRPVGGAG